MHPFPYVDAVNFAFRPWLNVQSIQDICDLPTSSSPIDCTSHGIPKLSDFIKSSTQPPLITSSRIATASSVLSLPALDPVLDDEVEEKEPVGMTLSPIPSADETATATEAGAETVTQSVVNAPTATVNETPVRSVYDKWSEVEEAPSWHSVFVNPPLYRVVFRGIQRGVNHLLGSVNAGEQHVVMTNYSAIPFGEADEEEYGRIVDRVSVGEQARREA